MSAKVTEAINAVMGKVGYIQKKGTNSFHNYKFAAIGDVLAELQPAMQEAGLIVVQDEVSHELLESGAIMTARYAFSMLHKSGEAWPHVAHHTGMAAAKNKNGSPDDKALNKCHTAARKYFLMALFQIPTGDHADPDADGDVPVKTTERTPEPLPKPQNVHTPHLSADQCRLFRKVGSARMTPAEGKRKINFDDMLKELYQTQSPAEVAAYIKTYQGFFDTWPEGWLVPFDEKIAAHENELAKLFQAKDAAQ
jgi:hypothetical protein